MLLSVCLRTRHAAVCLSKDRDLAVTAGQSPIVVRLSWPRQGWLKCHVYWLLPPVTDKYP